MNGGSLRIVHSAMRARFALLLLGVAAAAPAGAQPAPVPVHPGPPAWPGAAFFAANRQRFLATMGDGIAIFPAQPEIPRNDDAGYPFRQDSDFWWLTGFEEPGAVAVLRAGAPEGERFALFVRPRNPDEEVWTGRRAGVEGARESYGAELAWVVDSLGPVLDRWLAAESAAWFDDSEDHPWAVADLRSRLESWAAGAAGRRLRETGPVLSELRLRKSDPEIAELERAIALTDASQRAAMAAIRPGMYEYEVQALIEFVYRAHGSPRVGFNTIVGSGPNGTTLHYEENTRRMEADDLVVMDIGAEWNHYTADVTRTVPVDGTFDADERTIYQIVLDAQNAAIARIRPGEEIADVHEAAVEVVTRGLIDAGILSGTVEANVASDAYEPFFMHGTSHWLGLDVHDVGSYAEPGRQGVSRILRPGMVLTVEPGIYIREGTASVDPRWWGIGIRIEDDVLVTEDGHRVLSTSPREIEDIEALMAGRGVPSVVP